jgi:hypothetical protein
MVPIDKTQPRGDMLITTLTNKKLKQGNVIASIEGTFEDAYDFAMRIWHYAGNEGVHMDGLEIWDDEGDEPKKMLDINYCTHER